MVDIDPKARPATVVFRRKDQRPNKRDDKFEIFRNAIGLRDTRDIFELSRYVGHHATDEIHKDINTITDINSYEFPFINVKLTEEQANRLRRDPNIEYVQFSPIDRALAQVLPWGIAKVRSPQAWTVDTKRGQGAIVAVLDTGSNNSHPDLKANYSLRQSFIPGDSNPEAAQWSNVPAGYSAHGIHVAGTIAAIDNTEHVIGVAPSCKIISCRVLTRLNASDQFTSGFGDWQAEAIIFAMNNGANVINMSLGGTQDFGPRADALRNAYDNKNILTCVSTGNDGRANGVLFPAKNYGAIGVSALEQTSNNPASFSNGGPENDVIAPGTNILSCGHGTSTLISQGTSMACPHVAGVCALGYSAYKEDECNPIYTGKAGKANKSVEEALYRSCNKLGRFSTRRHNDYGRGMPEADKIVKMMMGIQV